MYRTEHPRPDFARDTWFCLNGEWDFAFDDQDTGIREHWEKKDHSFPYKIQVPFSYQAPLSGIADSDTHDTIWYKRTFTLPQDWPVLSLEKAGDGNRLPQKPSCPEKNILLHFGAVDYYCRVYVNGVFIKEHEGGHTPFSCDITYFLLPGENTITVYVHDPSFDESIPRGKQTWQEKPKSIWYTRTSGIWQTVWLELVDSYRFLRAKTTPDPDTGLVHFSIDISRFQPGLTAEISISFQDETIIKDTLEILDSSLSRSYDIFGQKIFRTAFHSDGWAWTPDNPNLFDVCLRLLWDGEEKDRVNMYFGMRKIHTEKGQIFLNNQPYYLKMVLDQGYWPEGLLTAPSDESFIRDIQMAKEMGFNGCRKHQKIEDPRFLYWADKLGFLVWGEMPAAHAYTGEAVTRVMNEFSDEIKRDYNHPCIIAWVPINESWGVPNIAHSPCQQSHSLSLYHLAKSLDPTRLVIANDGWETTHSDICGIHNYAHGNPSETEKFAKYREVLSNLSNILYHIHGRAVYADGFSHRGEPVMLSEFGGISIKTDDNTAGWGYTSVSDGSALLQEYRRIIDAIRLSTALSGFCYTQLTDVEQETNGLLTYDRKPKCDLSQIRKINEKEFY